eukprot:750349-Hanusia_phi.AAC.4
MTREAKKRARGSRSFLLRPNAVHDPPPRHHEGCEGAETGEGKAACYRGSEDEAKVVVVDDVFDQEREHGWQAGVDCLELLVVGGDREDALDEGRVVSSQEDGDDNGAGLLLHVRGQGDVLEVELADDGESMEVLRGRGRKAAGTCRNLRQDPQVVSVKLAEGEDGGRSWRRADVGGRRRGSGRYAHVGGEVQGVGVGQVAARHSPSVHPHPGRELGLVLVVDMHLMPSWDPAGVERQEDPHRPGKLQSRGPKVQHRSSWVEGGGLNAEVEGPVQLKDFDADRLETRGGRGGGVESCALIAVEAKETFGTNAGSRDHEPPAEKLAAVAEHARRADGDRKSDDGRHVGHVVLGDGEVCDLLDAVGARDGDGGGVLLGGGILEEEGEEEGGVVRYFLRHLHCHFLADVIPCSLGADGLAGDLEGGSRGVEVLEAAQGDASAEEKAEVCLEVDGDGILGGDVLDRREEEQELERGSLDEFTLGRDLGDRAVPERSLDKAGDVAPVARSRVSVVTLLSSLDDSVTADFG